MSLSFNLLSSLDNNSVVKIKREGDKGSPCFDPLVELEKCLLSSLMLTEYQTSDSNLHVKSVKILKKLYHKFFFISNLKTRLGLLPLLINTMNDLFGK